MTTSVTETHSAAAPKIPILGATGPTGRHIVSQAVRRSYDVTVMVRLPEKVADMKRAKFVVGDSRDEKVLSQAVKARYAVISALGTPRKPISRSHASFNLDQSACQRHEGRARAAFRHYYRYGRWRCGLTVQGRDWMRDIDLFLPDRSQCISTR